MKLTFKSLFITGFIFCTTFQLRAQAYPVEKVNNAVPGVAFEPTSTRTKKMYFETGGDKIIISRNLSKLEIDQSINVQILNSEGTVQKSSFEYKYDKGFFYSNMLKYDGKLYLITYDVIEKPKYKLNSTVPGVYDYYYSEILSESGKVGSRVKFFTGSENIKFIESFGVNKDQLVVENSIVNDHVSNKTEIEYIVFDKGFELNKKGKFEIPVVIGNSEDLYGINYVNNQFNYLCLVHHKKLAGIVLLSYNTEDGSNVAKVIDIGVRYISNFNFLVQDDHTLVGFGLYSNENEFSTDGLVSFRYSMENNEVTNVSRVPIPQELISQFSDDSKLKDVKIKYSQVDPDGKLYVGIEEQYFMYAALNTGSIYVMAVNEDGTLEYAKKLPKFLNCKTDRNVFHFNVIDLGESLLFYYLDSPENENLNFDQKPKGMNVTSTFDGELVAYKMNKSTGKITKSILLTTDIIKQEYSKMKLTGFDPYVNFKLEDQVYLFDFSNKDGELFIKVYL